MLKRNPAEHFTFAIVAGAICGLTILVALAFSLIRHEPFSLTAAWFVVGVAIPVFVIIGGLAPGIAGVRRGRLAGIWQRVAASKFLLQSNRSAQWAMIALFAFFVIGLSWWSARKYAVVFGLAETAYIYRSLSNRTRSLGWYLALFMGIIATWAFTLGFTYTHVSDWLLNGTGSSDLALPAFLIAFGIALYLTVSRKTVVSHNPRVVLILQFTLATVVFFLLGLRIDNEAALWIPYHQSYFGSPAELVRAHHWLLWDIPSQYGFLVVLTIAAIPTATTFDAVYFATAAVLFLQAMGVFTVLYIRRSGWVNFAFALLLCCATFYSSQSAYYPFGARLYPQEGLRFLWPIAALLFAFWRYRTTSSTARRWALILGYASWLLAVLWSFETGAWTSIIWVGFLIAEAIEGGLYAGDVRVTLRICALRLGAMLLLLIAAMGVIELIYRTHFGHGPDWRAYVEFSAIYASSAQFFLPVDPFGASWTIAIVLIAVTSLTIVALRRKQYHIFPLLTACWAAVWGTSSYYVGEAFNQHVAMLSGILILVGAIIFYVTESDLRRGLTPLLARLSFLPISVLLIAYAFGAPTHIRDMRWPRLDNLGSALSEGLPTISGELLTLERKAGFKRQDEVLYPSRQNWNKLSNGFILPLERNSDGTVSERVAWLPMSPAGEYNTLMTLPPARRALYINRYLADSVHPHGWLIAYREPALCSQLSPELKAIKHVSTPNYNAAYCVLRSTVATPAPPVLTSIVGGSIPAHSDYVKITYVTKAGETLPSGESVNSLGPNALTVVQSPSYAQNGVIGYNVYAIKNNGGSGTGETLQNSSPVPLGSDYQEPADGWSTGGPPPPKISKAMLRSNPRR